MTARLQTFRERLGREEPWLGRSHRALFRICAVGMALYFSYTLFLAGSPVFSGLWETVYCLVLFFAYAGLIFLGLCMGCGYAARFGWGRMAARACREKLSLRFFALSAGLNLLLLGISLLAAYPGAVTYDVYNQWTQFQTGQFNGWHPIFHTLLLGIGGRLAGGYPGAVALQLAAFSGALAYLAATLRAWGVSGKALLALQCLIAVTPLVSAGMMSAGKDNAMTLGVTLLSAQSANLYFSRGEWARRKRNALAFGAALAFTTLVRHNAFFFTAPLLLCALYACRTGGGRLWLSAATAALCLGLVTGPLYASLDWISPKNTLEESVGIPMTILLDTRARKPEALDGETRAFLDTLIPEAAFAETYALHNYNSVKFTWPREYIAKAAPEKLLRMTLGTVTRDPRGAFETLNAVTDLVWDVTGKGEGVDTPGNSRDLAAYPPQSTAVNRIGKALETLVRVPLGLPGMGWLFHNIGTQMALLLLCGLRALYRGGPRALLLWLPVLFYNLGTMLLLCGNDARFFQFSMVVCLPAALALWRKPGEEAEAAA